MIGSDPSLPLGSSCQVLSSVLEVRLKVRSSEGDQ